MPRRVRNPFAHLEQGVVEDAWDDYRREDGEERMIVRRRNAGDDGRGSARKAPAGKRTERSAAGKRAERGTRDARGTRETRDTRDARGARGMRETLKTRGSRDARGMRETPVTGARKKSAVGPDVKTPVKKTSRPRPPKKVKDVKDPAVYGERLQKILATAGLGSRRDCEEYISAGRVMVDRTVVDELGARVMPHQSIHFDGELLRRAKKRFYFALNKPTNVICTNEDPGGRRRALDFIHENAPGLFPVGRLDLHSEGLLLITNDGELANRLTHPRYEVPKVYQVRVSGIPTREEIAQISRGVYLAEGLAKAEEVNILHEYKDGTAMLKITLREGRNREIRRILARVGHNVLSLQRVAIGPLKMGKMPPGAYRPLSREEVTQLRRLVGLAEEKK